MTREEIRNVLQGIATARLIGTKYLGKLIVDVDVQINNETVKDEGGGWIFNDLVIGVELSSPKGRSKFWCKYYI